MSVCQLCPKALPAIRRLLAGIAGKKLPYPATLPRLVVNDIKGLDLMDATNRKRVLAGDSNAALGLIFGIANE